MENLWAEWRSDFVLGEKEKYCVFCKRGRRKKRQQKLILYEGDHSFVIINLYPYNPGHLLIIPYRHLRNIESLSREEHYEMVDLVTLCVKLLKKKFKPHGVNIGMNLGAAAGAGIEYHLHYHVVPRFTGDANFMPVVGKTDVHSVDLDIIYNRLKPEFDRYKNKRIKAASK